MHNTFERTRKIASWIAALMAVAFIVLSAPPKDRYLINEILTLAGYSLLIVAALGRIWCSVYICGRKDDELCQDGPYSVCRNPLYVFSFLGMIGFALGARNLPILIVMVPVYWAFYLPVIAGEERRLAGKFGDAYKEYSAKVNRLLPRFKTFWSQTRLQIDPRTVSHTLLDAVWFFIAILLLEIHRYLQSPQIAEAGVIPVLFRLPF